MFYLLAVPISVYLLYQIMWLREMRKHDTCLYAFCKIRSNAIDFAYKEYENLSRDDYLSLRKIIKSLDTIIHNYKTYKTVIFNFRLFKKYLIELKSFEKERASISTSNPELKALVRRVQTLVFKSFLAYTPFLKSEIVVKILIGLLSAGVKSGIKSLKAWHRDITEVMQIVKQAESS